MVIALGLVVKHFHVARPVLASLTLGPGPVTPLSLVLLQNSSPSCRELRVGLLNNRGQMP